MHKDYWLNSSRYLQCLGIILLAVMLFAVSFWLVFSFLSSMDGVSAEGDAERVSRESRSR
ncbi:hypothetical protein [Pseudoteredinibacter isoporae]|uniref:Uncharacterized protein n=1 Tax=Pseudoteredinibacter isoporae TaxID=570281 RepID=A0A7X0MTY3_9GAMM|nr:hypothetical protein [Pseudoteredinibacter isoporae]MBB6520036.1 hypothetical protein [Pseudoteredinibacter isoporae]NHO85608.1 hypothetical protein [Pseudoteredinibacter isoporae]NIB25940.1 hypothetical protein [Pseudoteredinibacter isoporae]